MARAFSLLELLVVMSIFAIITGIVLTNHRNYSTSVLLGNTAYSIALSIRQAQVYGLSTQQYNLATFQTGYGIRFQNATQYIFYADLNKNKKYDGTPTDAIIQTFTLGRGHTIKEYCGYDASNNATCLTGGGIDHLDVSFLRPDSDATITGNSAFPYSRGTVVIQSTSAETRTVTIAATGQISVTRP